MFVLSIIAAVLGIPALIIGLKKRLIIPILVGIVLTVLAILFFIGSTVYAQDPGEANVQKSVTGEIVGQTNSAGLQTKAPWVNVETFSIRNQQIVFAGTNGNTSDNAGGTNDGPQITVQDKDGVTSNIDIAVNYSIDAKAVTSIYNTYQTESNFKAKFLAQGIRSVVRLVPNSFSTLDLLTKRGQVEAAITQALQDRWSNDGVSVDSINLGEFRPPAAVVASYAAAVQAQINVTKEQSVLDGKKISAQTVIVEAKAQADANDLLTRSLSPQVLQNKYLDALKGGTVYVVPAGSTPFITAK